MALINSFKLNNNVDSANLWISEANEFDGLHQAIEELIDNSYSSFTVGDSNRSEVIVTVEELSGGRIRISVEDSGPGMKRELLDDMFSIAKISEIRHLLNEHGVGFKHAIAFANISNDSWFVATRTADLFKKGRFIKISSPYNFEKEAGVLDDDWPGILNGSGTYVEFVCPREIFSTITNDLRFKTIKGFADILVEELGYRYSLILRASKMKLRFRLKLHSWKNFESYDVDAIHPIFADISEDGGIPMESLYINLSSGNVFSEKKPGCVKLSFYFGRILKPKGKRQAFNNSIPKISLHSISKVQWC